MGDSAAAAVFAGADAPSVAETTGLEAAPPPPPPRRRVQLLDVEQARAILAEPFDEEAERDREIPASYVTDEHTGARTPLPGVASLFLTATTLQLIGCAALDAVTGSDVAEVTQEKLLADIQFRGVISDFHACRPAIAAADCEPLLLRANPGDVYGDGNNFDLVTTAAAKARLTAGDAELQRRRERDERVALRKLAARSLPRGSLPIQARRRRHARSRARAAPPLGGHACPCGLPLMHRILARSRSLGHRSAARPR